MTFKLYGLTGGIGMGKSTSDKLLRERGVPVVDTDLLARQLVEPGQPALKEIQASFGDDIVGTDGRLRREELARLVFSDEVARQKLENILHPRIRESWMTQIKKWREEGLACAVVDIPLLYETNAAGLFDAVICVACPAVTQQKRLLARGWKPDHIAQRLKAQWPVVKKMELANSVVWTEGDMETHAEQLRRIIA